MRDIVNILTLSVRKAYSANRNNLVLRLLRALFDRPRVNCNTPALKNTKRKILVYLADTHHYHSFHILAIARGLMLRGNNVKVAICNGAVPTCEKRSSQSPTLFPCLECKLANETIVKKFNIPIIDMANFAGKDKRKGNEETNLLSDDILNDIVNDSTMRHYYGSIPETEEAECVKNKHRQTAMFVSKFITHIFKTFKPEILLANMENYSLWRPAKVLAKIQKIPYITIAPTNFDYHSVSFSVWDLYWSVARYRNWDAARGSCDLNESEYNHITSYLGSRVKGESADIKSLNLNRKTKFSIKKLDDFRKVCLYANLFWEGGMYNTKGLFSSIEDWLVHSAKIIVSKKDTRLFVKVHPGEIRQSSRTGVEELLKQGLNSDEFSRIVFIDASSGVSPYEIAHEMDLNVVYNGTLGLELLCLGLPLISCGKSPYMKIIGSSYVTNIKKYEDYLLGRIQPQTVSQKDLLKFAYFYFIKNSIPWNITTKSFADRPIKMDIEDQKLANRSNHYFNHLLSCIENPQGTIPENW